ncbi:MAG: alpha-hydroxy acid oxidase [Solirubrobacteraceae bacterium]
MPVPQPSPSTFVSLADYEAEAERILDAGAHAYYAGGAGAELTLKDNAAAWQRLAIRPRALIGVGTRDPSVTVLGRTRPHPLFTAPMAFQAMAQPEGEIATARGAARAGATFCLSTLSTTSIPALAQAVPDAARWFQLYVFRDRGVSRELVAQAVDHGYEALVVTVDLPVLGRRERELRTGVHSASGEMVASARATGASGSMTPADFGLLIDPDLSWDDIEAFAASSPLPVVVKGLLRAEDAERAIAHGARAVVVSNHGGRQLDTTISSADALPAIVDRIADQADVLLDGGIRRGTDVLKALALGARAVMVGRPVLWGLACGGADGVARVFEILLAELDLALALAGAPRAAELDRELLTPAPWAPSSPLGAPT